MVLWSKFELRYGKYFKMGVNLCDLQVFACCTSSINSCFHKFKFKFTNVTMAISVYGVSLRAHNPFIDEKINSRSHSLPSGADRDRPDVPVNIVLSQQDTVAIESSVFLCPTVSQYRRHRYK